MCTEEAFVERLSACRSNLPRFENGAKVWKLDEGLRVEPSRPLMADLKALLGPSCVNV